MIESMVPIALLAVMAALLVPFFLKARAEGQLTACHSNLKIVATALEMYAEDARGAYPAQLDRLVAGRYLKTIPTCSAVGADGYAYSHSSTPAAFTVYCRGVNHKKVGPGPDFPRYTSWEGLSDGEMGPRTGWLGTLFESLRAVALWPVWLFFLFRLGERPRGMGAAYELEQKHRPLAVLAWLGWLSLSCLLTAGVWLGSRSLWQGQLSPLLAPLLGSLGSEWLVRCVWWVSAKLSPAASPDRPSSGAALGPALGAGRRARLGRPRVVPLLTAGAPLVLVAAVTLAPLVGPHPERDPFLGLAVGALLSFPCYLWARNWAGELFDRELELLPGSGILLEHSRRWARARVTRLGTLADVHGLSENGFCIGQRRFRVEDSEFLEALE